MINTISNSSPLILSCQFTNQAVAPPQFKYNGQLLLLPFPNHSFLKTLSSRTLHAPGFPSTASSVSFVGSFSSFCLSPQKCPGLSPWPSSPPVLTLVGIFPCFMDFNSISKPMTPRSVSPSPTSLKPINGYSAAYSTSPLGYLGGISNLTCLN